MGLQELIKFPKGTCKVLDPGQSNDMHLDRLGLETLNTALQKKDLRIMMDKKLKVSWHCALQ